MAYKLSGCWLSPEVTLDFSGGTTVDSEITWTADDNGETMTVQTSVDGGSTWDDCTSGNAVPNIDTSTTSLQVKVSMETAHTDVTPELYDLLITISSDATGDITCLAVATGSLPVFSGDSSGRVKKMNTQGQVVWTVTPHSGRVNSLAVAKANVEGSSQWVVVSASDDDEIAVHDFDGVEFTDDWPFTGHSADVNDLACQLLIYETDVVFFLGGDDPATAPFIVRTDGSVEIDRLTINELLTLKERSSDPADPAEGSWTIWMSDGTETGDDGDILVKITAGGVTKTTTLIDFSGI